MEISIPLPTHVSGSSDSTTHTVTLFFNSADEAERVMTLIEDQIDLENSAIN